MDNKIESLKALLKDGSKVFIDLQSDSLEKFIKYKDLLIEWNQKINLTAITEDEDIIVKHFVDSLSIIPYIKNKDKSIIDVGTGAGFPGLPLKIVFKDMDVTLLDSLEKRVKYLQAVIDDLGLKKIKAIHGRAEDIGVHKDYREKFDMATARAVANLPVLLEYCMPFVKVNGYFIAMKGSNKQEIEASKNALEVLGGKIEDIKEFTLPLSDSKRNIIIIKKFRQTPTKYPRKAGKPSKEPL